MLIELFDLTLFRNLYFYFRQVDPTSDNVAANCLQSCMQQRNVRKVEVNAKITFIIWLLEIFSIIVVAAVGVVAGMKETASVLYLLFYYVILPLVFVINTSDNKDRLVDFGFCNLIRATICYLCCRVMQNDKDQHMNLDEMNPRSSRKTSYKEGFQKPPTTINENTPHAKDEGDCSSRHARGIKTIS